MLTRISINKVINSSISPELPVPVEPRHKVIQKLVQKLTQLLYRN